jgi:hypothetical protein
MKKLKRTLSLTLVAAMVLGTFGISAMATDEGTTTEETPTNNEETSGSTTSASGKKEITSLKVTKKIECTQNVSLPTETFTVTMVPATGSDLFVPELDKDGNAVKDDQGNVKTTNKVSGVTVQSGPELADNDVTFTVNSSTNTSSPNGVTLTEDLSLALKTGEAFTESGIYRYVVTETIPDKATTNSEGKKSNGYVVYDTQKYTVDLYVKQDDDKNFYIYDTVLYGENATKPTNIKFTNKINTSTLTISKVLGDNTTEVKSGQLYEFKILIPVTGDTIKLDDKATTTTTTEGNAEAAAENNYVQAHIYNDNGLVIDQGDKNDEEKVRTDSEGLVKLYINGETINSDIDQYGTTFYLKADEWLVVSAPVSMIFKVKEKDYSSQDYTTTYTYNEKGTYTASLTDDASYNDGEPHDGNVLEKGTVNNQGTTVKFTNTRVIKLDTGIVLDVIPYVLILVAAAACGIVFISKKRRAVR